MDADLMRRRFAEARVGRLATVSAGGAPHVVPVCFALEGNNIYWAVDHKPKSTSRLRRLDNIRVHPAVELVADNYEEDWARIWWVRVGAEAAILESGPEAEHGLDLLAAKYPQYRAVRPLGPVVRMAVLRWTSWPARS